MRPLYDDEPDEDDLLLKAAITNGIVPPRCKLGGPIVQGIAAAGGDPCMTCDVDRDSCGGRLKLNKPPHPMDKMMEGYDPGRLNDSTNSRKHQRQLTITQLNRMIKEKK